MEIITVSCSVLCFFYLQLHSLFLWLASLFLNREQSLLVFLKCLNLPYLLIHIFVLLTYATGEFSILSGWEFVQSAIESEIRLSAKILMAAFFTVVVPVALFFMSIMFGYMSYARILRPAEVLYDQEYGLKKFYGDKTEKNETKPEEAKVFWLDYANYIFAEQDRTFLGSAESSVLDPNDIDSRRFEQCRYVWRLIGKQMVLVSAGIAGQLLRDEAEWDDFQTTLNLMAVAGTSVLQETSSAKYDFSSMPQVQPLDAQLLTCEIDYEDLGRHLLKAVGAFFSSNNPEALDDLVDVYVQAFELFGVDHDQLRVRGENILRSARLSLLKHC